ncbi:MAG: lysyl endopeptidase [Bacteroidetes bacterium QH_7_62_13]|nr:MAG: lysyl endopeptidase [Bacteroidetes bacterium QH_7_62_13]
MISSRSVFRVLPLLLVLGGLPSLLLAQDPVRLPSQQQSTVQSLQSVELRTLPQVDTERLREEDRARDGDITPYRYGTTVETDLTARRNGTWESLPSGGWLWRLRIQSKEAVSLSAVFTDFRLPAGGEIYVYAPDGTLIRGPYTREDVTAGQHRTPMVRGDELIIEMNVPRGRRRQTSVTIGKIVHGYRSLFPSQRNAPQSKAGDCNIDVACDDADPWRDQVRSVARITFESGGDTFSCTGSLVNTTAQRKIPYFLTAEHCISTPEEAASMVFYWNYQNPTCRTPGTSENGRVTDDDAIDQTSTGAVLRARYGNVHDQGQIEGKPDLALVEIDDFIPLSYDLYFNGWNRMDTPTDQSVTIHHPRGHGKRISFDDNKSAKTEYANTTRGSGDTHLLVSDWERGTTEGGSSGAPLYDTNQRVVGVLSGGLAGCNSSGDGSEDNNEPDWYGRVAPGFLNGDYESRTLSSWLDPSDSGTGAIDGLPLFDRDDSTAPSQVDDLTVTNVDTTSMTVSWSAPGDNGDQGRAYAYDLRYASSPIPSTSDFSSAPSVTNVPLPKTAQTQQEVTVDGLVPDSTYYFALRTKDDGGNQSPIAATDGTLLQDLIPPSRIRDLRITEVNTSELSVRLEWTATGDDRRQGTPSNYDLRYAEEPIRTPQDFEQANQISDVAPPAEAGETQSAIVDQSDGLAPENTYHFALRATDNAGNASPKAVPEQTAVLTEDIDVQKTGPVSSSTSSTTKTTFVLTDTQEVRVALYDLLGRRVRVLFEDRVSEGFEQTVRYDVRGLSSGPYFLRFSGESFTKTRRVMIVK